MVNKSRKQYLDTVGGILLLHMILLHICQWSDISGYYIFFKSLFAFFMPWFFFKAGMFYKSRPMKDEGAKSFKRLIVPFIVFSVIGTLVLWTKQIVLSAFSVKSILDLVSGLVWVGAVEGNLPMWFLLSLFAVKTIFNFIYRLNKSLIFRVGLILCLSVVWIAVLFVPIKGEVFHPLYFSNVSSGLAYFSLGYLLRNYKPSDRALILFSLMYVILLFVQPIQMDMRAGKCLSPWWLYVPQSLLGILAINGIARMWLNRQNLFSRIGQDSMAYYCLHWIIIVAVSIFFPAKTGCNFAFFFALVGANMVGLPLLNYAIKQSRFKNFI